mmetsp:Transcript_37070/g.89403  ORF Transcript_37070/g.89403 Transcript_37070/m.89403 type:complete len:337 (+) Transcript_37070:160-1170(+)
MVDYSKWDRMDFSESDSESDKDGNGPRVTSLEQPGKVTIGPDGNLEIGQSSLPTQPRTQSLASSQNFAQGIPTVSGSVSGDTVDISSRSTISPDELDNKQKDKKHQWRSQLTQNGGEHHCTVRTDQGENKLPVYWSQDRYTITLRLGIPPAIFPTRGIRVRTKGALKYLDRFSAVGSGVASGYKSQSDDEPSYGSVEIVSISSQNEEETVLLSGELSRPIHLNQDEDEIDFEIEDYHGRDNEYNCTKCVTIIMPKAVPMAGMVLWWDRPLDGFPQIDVSMIDDRNPSRQTAGGEKEPAARSKDDKKASFQKAWEEAHTMFREKMKTKEKQSIEINE